VKLGRRAFLGGAGAVVALPFLESLLPRGLFGKREAEALAAVNARRLVFIYVPCGMHMPAWKPAAAGAGYALTPILQPLAMFKDDFSILTNLKNYGGEGQGDGAGDHARGTGSFLTAVHVEKTSGADIRNGVSVDQIAAGALRGMTPFASLELGAEGGSSTGDCDSGYSCAYVRNISWSGPQTPVAKEVNPLAVFDRLYQGVDPTQTQAEILKRRRYKQSVIDYVREDATSLQGKLGVKDKAKLDEYLTGLRDVEQRLQGGPMVECQAGARPEQANEPEARIKQMLDLIALALQCDQTRVATFMLGNGGSNRAFPFLPGVTGAHHELSHHQGDAAKHAQLQTIDTWEVGLLAYFLGKLKAIQEPDGTVLDNSLVFFSSEISDGDRHNHDDLPVLLAGKGGGAAHPGRHIVLPDDTPIANLFISMLASVGVAQPTFGDDGTGPLADL
jgi:hypothetical protein